VVDLHCTVLAQGTAVLVFTWAQGRAAYKGKLRFRLHTSTVGFTDREVAAVHLFHIVPSLPCEPLRSRISLTNILRLSYCGARPTAKPPRGRHKCSHPGRLFACCNGLCIYHHLPLIYHFCVGWCFMYSCVSFKCS
jgi:hypothetical protein